MTTDAPSGALAHMVAVLEGARQTQRQEDRMSYETNAAGTACGSYDARATRSYAFPNMVHPEFAEEAARKRAEMEAKMGAAGFGQQLADACLKPKEPERPLLSQLYDQLLRSRDSLMDARGRIEGATSRILGPVPSNVCATGGTNGPSAPPCSADELLALAKSIAIQVELLHDVALRVERIG